MKRTTLMALAILGFWLAVAPAFAASNDQDFKVIQKAVRQSPASDTGGEVKWFKVLITDSRSGEAKVKVALPIALIEAVLACTDGKHFKISDGDCGIDLKAVFAALKKAGRLALVEIEDDGAVVKVWLE
jgi:sugar phosphate isomerase/epimerase